MKFKKLKLLLAVTMVFSSLNILAVHASENSSDRGQYQIQKQTEGKELSWDVEPGSEILTKVSIGTNEINYSYNNKNNRIAKKTDNNQFTYTYDDNSNNLVSETREALQINYLYDDFETITGFILNQETYYYIKDSNFSVISILDENGKEVAKYEYDSNGIVSSILGQGPDGSWVDRSKERDFIGTINLIRLYSLYYDEETQWYYNGLRYYDSVKNEYIKGANKLPSLPLDEVLMKNNGIIAPMTNYQLIMQIQQCQTDSLNSNTFGKAFNTHSTNWYSNLSTLELLARLLYAENTLNPIDQYSVAWVIINRKNANQTKFGGSTYHGVATKSGQFQPITGSDADKTKHARIPSTSSNQWQTAIWSACTMTYTTSTMDYDNLIPKGHGISNHLYFVGLNYYMLSYVGYNKTPVGSGIRIDMGSGVGIVDMKNVVIVYDTTSSYQNPPQKSAIESQSQLDDSSKRNRHNIFFNI
ncbi:hypothetical protein D3P09_12690 [Paenibacillus pinisoli]|uniref:Uncharacterized protein n=1 Tax=Paenibacillus pinisoli TaxID=1276110 RepID=A0A3A6PPQ6_9BACL|nr:cell wall hydrolase [Paenibacillus pinisoli]RJX40209.1 hypothetical protein D3P09_12690 [Paenibacillus pinisoli]